MMPTARVRWCVWWAVACGLSYACEPALAQVSSLSLSPATGSPGSTASLALSLGGAGTAPAGLQWTLAYPTGQIYGVSATAGPAATVAGKTLSCAASPGLFTCVLAGLNTNAIAAGVVANVQVTLAANATTTSIGISNAVGVDGSGSGLPALATVGAIVSVPALSSITCIPGSLNAGQISACTITMNMGAPAGGTAISPASDNASLAVPATVTVAAGATTATFNATASATIASNQSATVTATLGSSSQTAAISLVAPVLVSGVTCSPASVGQSTTSTCAVTLNQTAPAGGWSVTLASSSASLTVPAMVTVAAGATTATFSATAAAAIASNQNAAVTATLGSSAQTATVSLVAPVLVSGVACSPSVLGAGGSSDCTVSLTQAVPAISLVHVTSCGPQTFPTSTCTIPATGSGNLIVVGWQAGGGVNTSVSISSVTDNAGNTYAEAGAALSADAVAGSVADIWYAMNSVSGATTLTITSSSTINDGGAVIWEFSGADLSAPLDQTAILNSQFASATPTGATVTTTAGADVVISLAPVAGNVTGILPGNSFVSDSAIKGNGWAHLITTSAGAYAAQWNQNPAGTYASSTVAFKAAGSVTLTSNNPTLTVPATVTVPVGAGTATFSATAGSFIASNQSATVMATLGSSSQTATIGLLAPVLVSGVTCNGTGVMSGASTTCLITLSQAVSADTIVSLSSSSALLSIPATVAIPAGYATGSVTATAGIVPSNTQAAVSATLGVSSQNATVLLWSTPKLSSLACTPVKIVAGAIGSCTVALSNPAGDLSIAISSSSVLLVAPANVTVPQGASSTSFTVLGRAVFSHSIVLTASYNGESLSQSFVITAGNQTQLTETKMQSISCEPGRSHGTCRIVFRTPPDSGTVDLSLASSNQSIKLPPTITAQPGQSSVSFRIDAIPPANGNATAITAQLGADVVQETVSLDSTPGPQGVPGYLYARYGTHIQFRVSASDPSAALTASDLPPGAVFDAAAGVFQWVPDVASQGIHHVVFTEIGSAGGSIRAKSTLEVDSGTPVVTRVVNAASLSESAACSPGAIASLEGKWLVEGPATSDATGHSTKLSGTVVRVNGVEVPIIAVSVSRVDFLCPAAAPGSTLQIALETPAGAAQLDPDCLSGSCARHFFTRRFREGTGHGNAFRHSDHGDDSELSIPIPRGPARRSRDSLCHGDWRGPGSIGGGGRS